MNNEIEGPLLTYDQMGGNDSLSCTNSLVTITVVVNHRNIPRGPRCLQPMTNNGEPFHFLPTAPDVLFYKGSPLMKKVIMTVQPDSPQSASKRRQTSGSAAPRVPTKKRKIFTRRVLKKTAQPSPSPSESNTNQVIHLSEIS